jgi:hypothetical protein
VTTRPRPLLAVRLIGPAAVVAEQKARLLTQLADTFGDRANYHTSTRPPSYLGETRTYITVTAKEVPPR